MAELKKFVPFVKVDSVRREVSGIVTAEQPDKDLEVCAYEESKPYYKAVIQEIGKATDGQNYFPLREMHQLKAAGKCIGFEFNDADREICMTFKVVDDDAWKKVEERVYTGFSQGGRKVGDQIPDPVHKGCMRYVADPSEISLVDNPCLPSAHFAYVKSDGGVEMRKFLKTEAPEVTRITALEAEVSLLKATTIKAEPAAAAAATVDLTKEAKTKRVAGKDLHASDFAYVGDSEKTETWKFPIHDKCLHGDTLIPLLDGTSTPIRELVGKSAWIYSFDVDRRCLVPGLATNVRRTLVDVEVVRVTLDTGESVVCTSNHPFLLKKGQYKMAGELAAGDSLMPLYRKEVRQRAKTEPYEQIYQPWFNFWEWTHHMVNREFSGVPLMKGNVVHHKDETPLNNEPFNLEQLSREAHCALHGELNGWSYLPKLHAAAAIWSRSLEGRENHRRTVTKRNAEAKAAGFRYNVKPFPEVREAYDKYIAGRSLRSLAEEYGFSHTGIRDKFKEAELPSKKELSVRALNHSVVAVECAGHADVYDLEVEGFHNFGLSCGIFVHNSHARNALARFNQAKGIPSGEKAKVRAKIVAAAKKFGIEVSSDSEKIAAIGSLIRKTARIYINTHPEIVSPRVQLLDTELGKLNKGMYEVSRLAGCLDGLQNLIFSVCCEQEWEGDSDSPIPELLAENISDLAETLIEMVEEEARELVEEAKKHAKV